jgi:SAM-dependent methyltransferase
MSAPDPAKIQIFREHLHREWTDEQTIAAWRKWHGGIAVYSRGATDAILEAAHIRPGQRVLDLASGAGDPALSIAAAVAPTGRVTATDLGPGMMSLAEEIARKQGLTNIEFREADAEALPFTDESYDVLTCRFGIMFFPDLGKALRECLRVVKSGGRAAFVAWGKMDQPFFTATAANLIKHLPVPPPPPDPDAPGTFMFGERGRLRTINGHWAGPPEEYWQQFSEVAAPFRPLLAQLSPEKKAAAVADILASLKKFWNGKELNMPLEIVIGSGTRP